MAGYFIIILYKYLKMNNDISTEIMISHKWKDTFSIHRLAVPLSDAMTLLGKHTLLFLNIDNQYLFRIDVSVCNFCVV